jgi:hypothetical protein
MKRLPVVAIGVAALCALASGAEARSDDMRLGAYDGHRSYAEGDWEDYQPRRPVRRSIRSGKSRHAAHRPWRRATVRGGGRRSQAAYAALSTPPARAARNAPMASRGFIGFARGGVARTCLSSPARALLERIEAQFGAVRIVSTCRPGAVIAGSGRPSRHASGNAIDFDAPAGRKSEVVQWLIANHRSGGVMTYAAMNHIHVDIGRHFVALGSGGRRTARR